MDWLAFAWVLAGILLLIFEALVTQFIAVFFGVAAILVGLAIWLGFPGDGLAPWALFGVLSIALIVGLRRRFREMFTGSVVGDGSGQSQDDDFHGHEAVVVSGFDEESEGRGEVEFRGANWSARAEAALEVGQVVVIQGRDNLTLLVGQRES